MTLGRSPWTDIKKVEIFEDSTGAAPARLLVKLRDSPDQVLSFMAPALGVEEGCTLTRVAMQLIKGAKAADLKAGRKEKRRRRPRQDAGIRPFCSPATKRA